MSGVSPGMRSATTLLMERGFWNDLSVAQRHALRIIHTSTLTQLGGGASATRCKTNSRTSCQHGEYVKDAHSPGNVR